MCGGEGGTGPHTRHNPFFSMCWRPPVATSLYQPSDRPSMGSAPAPDGKEARPDLPKNLETLLIVAVWPKPPSPGFATDQFAAPEGQAMV
jgi:hypothetical protein